MLSGPVGLILIAMVNYFKITDYSMRNYADIIVLVYIFCVERIRILISDIYHILRVSKKIILATILCFYVYSYIAYRLF